MASAVTVIFGANSTQFQAELAKMQTMTAASAARITTVSGGAHGFTGMTGIIRESTVIGREIAMGRGLGRILGSLTLLIQYISSASRAAQAGASAARMLSDAYAEAAVKANVAAVAAMRKAEATAVAAEADGFEDEASIAAADASAVEATSARAAAAALEQKAAAAATDAAAQEALAASTTTAGISFLGIVGIFGAVALAAGAVYEAFWGVKNIINELTFSGAADLKDNYIPLLKRHINDARNAEKEVTDEVQKTVDAYNSAAAAAARRTKSTKEHFDSLEKIAKLEKDPAKVLQVEKDRERAELADKILEKTNLEIESKSKMFSAGNIHIATKEEDEKTLQQLNQNAEAAEEFMKKNGTLKEFKINAAETLTAGKNDAEIEAARLQGIDSAGKAIAERNAFANKVETNDELRKTKSELEKGAAKSAAAAMKIALDLPEFKNEQAKRFADMQAELAAKVEKPDKVGAFGLNSQQRIGAYVAAPPVLLEQLIELRAIRANTTHKGHDTNHPPGPKPPQYSGAPKYWPGHNVFGVDR